MYLLTVQVNVPHNLHMISLVVPTMWRHAPFVEFLEQVCAHPVIQDVIIIDNCVAHRPHNSIFHHDKMRLKEFGRNIHVNPAWNVGVYESTCDHVCIMNDDIKFDIQVFDLVDEFMKPHMGLISLCASEPVQGDIYFEHWQGAHMFGCGQLMFVHRQQYVDIDPELQVYCGDNWLFDHLHHVTGENYLIRNLTHDTPYACTSRDFRHLLHAEMQHYEHIMNKKQIVRLHV